MKRWLILFIVIVMVISIVIPITIMADSGITYCSICGNSGYFTGKVTYNSGYSYKLYKCRNNHTWWVKN